MKKVNHTIRIVTVKVSQKKVDRLVDVITVLLKVFGVTAVIFVDEPKAKDEQKGQIL